ncbi:TonB family protein [Parasphingorhabdus sp.]|uniref:TonB family protein n=1 Tax=Parasphingorhabdus sp. TaxID=2709688 RepID=UPI003593A6A5
MRIAPPTESELEKLANPENGAYILPPISDERKAAVTELTIGRPLSQPVTLKLGAMDKPLAALSECQDELMTHWGIDVEKHRNLSSLASPEGNPGRWVNANDYPSGMLARGKEAIVHFRMSVDENGDATDCHIQQSTRPKEFDEVVCRSMMKRAKFSPAIDHKGSPIASYYRNTVRFKLP